MARGGAGCIGDPRSGGALVGVSVAKWAGGEKGRWQRCPKACGSLASGLAHTVPGVAAGLVKVGGSAHPPAAP